MEQRCLTRGYRTAVSRTWARAGRREGSDGQGMVKEGWRVAGCALPLPPLPGTFREARASSLFPWAIKCVRLCVQHMELGGGEAGEGLPLPQGNSEAPPPLPGPCCLVTQIPEGDWRGAQKHRG